MHDLLSSLHPSSLLFLLNSTPPLVSSNSASCHSHCLPHSLVFLRAPSTPARPSTRLESPSLDVRQRGQSVTFNNTPPCLCPSPSPTTAARTAHPQPSAAVVTRRMQVPCHPRLRVVMRSSRSLGLRPDACSARRQSTEMYSLRKVMPRLPTTTSSRSGCSQTSSLPLQRRDL